MDRLNIDLHREVHVIADPAVPYRCVGAVIYVLQAKGIMKIGFGAAPPSIH